MATMKMRKKYQRKLNRFVHNLNENVRNDNLWLGRFEMRQKDVWFEEFSDHSGGILHVILRICDKVTGYYKDYSVSYINERISAWRIWSVMNTFITEDCNVWRTEPRPSLNNGFVRDCREMETPKGVMRGKNNWYLKYEAWKEN